MSKSDAWSLLMAIFVIAIIFMLVRPGSPAADAVKEVTDVLVNIINQAIHGLPDQKATPKAQAT